MTSVLPPNEADHPRHYRMKRSAATLVSAQALATGAPFSAMVEIADRCNEACVHCYQVQGQKGELQTDEWERIFRELAELGVLFLTISGGEPTLRKDFLHLVAYARELRFAVKIFSNALNITDAMAAELGRLSVQEVQISLYSHRAEAHDGVTRVPGSFNRIVSAVKALRAHRVKVVLKSPLMLVNAPEYSEYVGFVTGLDASYSLDPKLNPRENGDMAPTKLAIDKQAYLQVLRDPRFAPTRPALKRSLAAAPCGACSGNLHLEANGELRPCTQWDIPTGQAKSTSLREAWYGDPNATTIRALTWNDLPGCRRCDLRDYCQRCFAEAERYTGDALAPYAPACRSARWKYEAELGVEPEIDTSVGLCAAQPIGPFRRAGEHRFLLDDLLKDHAETVAVSGVDRTEPARAPLGVGGPRMQLIQLRRPSAALTSSQLPPSEPEG